MIKDPSTVAEEHSPAPEPLHPTDSSDELLAILRRVDQLEAQAATVLEQMNDAVRWRRMGYTSASAFLKHRAAFSASRAWGLVTRANALTAMPITLDHFERGELSVEQVDALVAAYNFNTEAFTADEADLVSLAIQQPFVRELWKLLEYWKRSTDPQLTEETQDMLNSLRGIRVRRDRGVGRAYVCLSETELDTFINAIDPGPPVPQDHRTVVERRADRLMELTASPDRMDRPQLLVHVSLDDLTGVGSGTASESPTATDSPASSYLAALPHQLAETEYGTVLTPEGVSRIACDASVCRVVFGPGGQALDVGRQHRLFTDPMRRAIIARDRHCRFPGCDRPPQWCDLHHIEHWTRGGTTCVDNGVLLCRFHHTLVHETGWKMTGTATSLIVYDDLGRRYAPTRPRRLATLANSARGP